MKLNRLVNAIYKCGSVGWTEDCESMEHEREMARLQVRNSPVARDPNRDSGILTWGQAYTHSQDLRLIVVASVVVLLSDNSFCIGETENFLTWNWKCHLKISVQVNWKWNVKSFISSPLYNQSQTKQFHENPSFISIYWRPRTCSTHHK